MPGCWKCGRRPKNDRVPRAARPKDRGGGGGLIEVRNRHRATSPIQATRPRPAGASSTTYTRDLIRTRRGGGPSDRHRHHRRPGPRSARLCSTGSPTAFPSLTSTSTRSSGPTLPDGDGHEALLVDGGGDRRRRRRRVLRQRRRRRARGRHLDAARPRPRRLRRDRAGRQPGYLAQVMPDPLG